MALRIWDGNLGLRLAARLPIGLNMMIPVSSIEIEPYIQAVPQIGAWLVHGAGLYWDVNFNIGVRFHF